MTADVYDLNCTDCPFTSVVEGDVYAVFDAIETHQADAGDGLEHFVNFAIRDGDAAKASGVSD